MPAADKIHLAVKNALIKDGWTITADPYIIEYADARLFADLSAERALAAERADRKIVVEVKSFLGPSALHELEGALGQYLVYRRFLELTAPEHQLYLAISDVVHADLFTRQSVQLIVQTYQLALLVVNVLTEEISQWIS
jgi:XisH protein